MDEEMRSKNKQNNKENGMGQYYLIVNIDKKQKLNPHKFGAGMKLMEFGNQGESIMTGLAVLLADGNGRGGGDLRSSDPVIGSWAGDRIVVTGDYADKGKFVDVYDLAAVEQLNLFEHASDNFEDISDKVITAIADGEGGFHSLSKLDLSQEGWRRTHRDVINAALKQDLESSKSREP